MLNPRPLLELQQRRVGYTPWGLERYLPFRRWLSVDAVQACEVAGQHQRDLLVASQAYYDALRARGVGHHAALRQLANRLVGILHGCLKTHSCYDEATAWSQHAHADSSAA
jgi:hypothetical protein